MKEHRKYYVYSIQIFLIYLIILSITHDEVHLYIKIGTLVISGIGLLFKNTRINPLFWLSIALVLLVNLVFRYTSLSNHYFLTFYTTLAIAVSVLSSEKKTHLIFRYLLIAVFFFAVLQKIINPYFTDGRLIGSHVLSGGMLYQVMNYTYPSNVESVIEYDSLLQNIKAIPSDSVVELSSGILANEILPIAQAITYFVLSAELLILILLLFKKSFDSPTFHILFVAFIWATAIFRPEYSFFSLLLILMLLAVEKWRRTPVILTLGSLFVLMVLSIVFQQG